jgi:hypothetical protein
MKTATTFSSGFVTCLALVSIACGGGGGDPEQAMADDNDGVCMAAMVSDANRLIAQHGDLQCRVWTVDGQIVDGAAYPQFLIGGDL